MKNPRAAFSARPPPLVPGRRYTHRGMAFRLERYRVRHWLLYFDHYPKPAFMRNCDLQRDVQLGLVRALTEVKP